MNKLLLDYSLSEDLTLSRLRKWWKSEIDPLPLLDWIEKNGVFGYVQDDAHYHYKLHHMSQQPYLYYAIGDQRILNKPLLGIVGPRKMTRYAQKVLEKLFDYLSSYDLATVSGLASGVDTACHTLSIQHGIPTVAVLWWGLWVLLQSRKKSLIHQIVDHWWLVLSEYKLWQKPTKRTYPQRNRIIAGLSQCLFVPEAAEGSGSLITVKYALQWNKSVYWACNWLFQKSSRGLHRYMQAGKVIPVVDMENFLLKEFGKPVTSFEEHHAVPDLSDLQQKILACAQKWPGKSSLSLVSEKLWIGVQTLLSELTFLEILWIAYEENGVILLY